MENQFSNIWMKGVSLYHFVNMNLVLLNRGIYGSKQGERLREKEKNWSIESTFTILLLFVG